jgi:hypothetical protein
VRPGEIASDDNDYSRGDSQENLIASATRFNRGVRSAEGERRWSRRMNGICMGCFGWLLEERIDIGFRRRCFHHV